MKRFWLFYLGWIVSVAITAIIVYLTNDELINAGGVFSSTAFYWAFHGVVGTFD